MGGWTHAAGEKGSDADTPQTPLMSLESAGLSQGGDSNPSRIVAADHVVFTVDKNVDVDEMGESLQSGENNEKPPIKGV